MSDDLFETDPLFDAPVEVEVGATEMFNSQSTVVPSKAFLEKTGAIPLYTHKPMAIPASNLTIDLSGADAMQSIDEILAGVKNEL